MSRRLVETTRAQAPPWRAARATPRNMPAPWPISVRAARARYRLRRVSKPCSAPPKPTNGNGIASNSAIGTSRASSNIQASSQPEPACTTAAPQPTAVEAQAPLRQDGVVDRVALHDGVGEQRVNGDPEQHVNGDGGGADPKFGRTDQAGDDERGGDRKQSRSRRLQRRPEHIPAHAGAPRTRLAVRRAASPRCRRPAVRAPPSDAPPSDAPPSDAPPAVAPPASGRLMRDRAGRGTASGGPRGATAAIVPAR